MPNEYRTRGQINWNVPVVIQMGMTGAAQFSNVEPPDTFLVHENGIWKYPRQAGGGANEAGAIVIPNTSATQRIGPVRLAAWQGNFNASAAWELWVRGNPANTTGTPYPSADAALYTEPATLVASGSGTSNISATYGRQGTGASVIPMPGQRFNITTTAASGASVRFHFEPL